MTYILAIVAGATASILFVWLVGWSTNWQG
jgi:hypothetical protein